MRPRTSLGRVSLFFRPYFRRARHPQAVRQVSGRVTMEIASVSTAQPNQGNVNLGCHLVSASRIAGHRISPGSRPSPRPAAPATQSTASPLDGEFVKAKYHTVVFEWQFFHRYRKPQCGDALKQRPIGNLHYDSNEIQDKAMMRPVSDGDMLPDVPCRIAFCRP